MVSEKLFIQSACIWHLFNITWVNQVKRYPRNEVSKLILTLFQDQFPLPQRTSPWHLSTQRRFEWAGNNRSMHKIQWRSTMWLTSQPMQGKMEKVYCCCTQITLVSHSITFFNQYFDVFLKNHRIMVSVILIDFNFKFWVCLTNVARHIKESHPSLLILKSSSGYF